MNEAEQFLKRILDQPDEDAPRLVFADWLEEQGDPRGEFIRLQCALAAGTGDESTRKKMLLREQELLSGKLNAWGAKPYRGIADRCRFRRGFIEQIAISAEKFFEHGDAIFSWAPLRRIRISNVPAHQVIRLANDPVLAQVAELDLSCEELHDDGIKLLLRSSHLHHLRWLNLSVNGLTDQAWTAIISSPALPALQWLDISHNHLRNLPAKMELSKLVGLDLSHNECSGTAIVHLANSRLRQLRVSGNPLGDEHTATILQKQFRQLAPDGVLSLADCGLGPASARALAEFPHRRDLHTINWEINAIGDEGLIAWTRATNFDRLTRLELAGNGITDRGALALTQSPLFRQLQHLDLRRNQLSREGIDTLWTHENRSFGSTLLLADNVPPLPLEESLPADAPLPVADEID